MTYLTTTPGNLAPATPYDDIATRTHPQYLELLPQWIFFKSTYEGGKKWFRHNIHKYFKEGPDEYAERVDRAYRANYTREIVDIINKYIFKADVSRSEDAPQFLKDFWKSTTLQKRPIEHFMDITCKASSIYGRIWIVVDSNASDDMRSLEDVKASDSRVYAYTVNPEDVIDLAYGADGELQWIKIREFWRDDEDPFAYTGTVTEQVRIWTRNEWFLFGQIPTSDEQKTWDLIDQGVHGLGMVPVTYLDHNESEDSYTSTSLIADIAYLDKAAANYRSNLDCIIQDQTFSQLVIPSEALTTAEGDDLADKLLEFGTKRIFLYASGESNAKPDYISPDPKQAGVIIAVLNKIISEIYASVGMGGERSQTDNAVGTDASGVAKAYDFERMNSLLANKAKALEFCENRIARIVSAWNSASVDPEKVENLVTYSKDFDVRNLADELDIANNLTIIEAPNTLRQEQMKVLVDKLYPQLAKKIKAQIEDDIDNKWLAQPEQSVLAPMMTKSLTGETSIKMGKNAQGQPAETSTTVSDGTNTISHSIKPLKDSDNTSGQGTNNKGTDKRSSATNSNKNK